MLSNMLTARLGKSTECVVCQKQTKIASDIAATVVTILVTARTTEAAIIIWIESTRFVFQRQLAIEIVGNTTLNAMTNYKS